MPKRILIVTDSLGAPRKDAEVISHDETWVGMFTSFLTKKGHEVFCITENGLSSGSLLLHTKSKLTLYSPDIVIFQYGVVDCAPRVLTEKEKLACRILGLAKIAQKIAHKYHAPLSKFRNFSLFSKKEFESNLKDIAAIFKKETHAKIINIAIAPANTTYIAKSPRIKYNISDFNKALKEHCDLFVEYPDSEQIAEKIFLPDAHHLNKEGHTTLYKTLKDNKGILCL